MSSSSSSSSSDSPLGGLALDLPAVEKSVLSICAELRRLAQDVRPDIPVILEAVTSISQNWRLASFLVHHRFLQISLSAVRKGWASEVDAQHVAKAGSALRSSTESAVGSAVEAVRHRQSTTAVHWGEEFYGSKDLLRSEVLAALLRCGGGWEFRFRKPPVQLPGDFSDAEALFLPDRLSAVASWAKAFAALRSQWVDCGAHASASGNNPFDPSGVQPGVAGSRF